MRSWPEYNRAPTARGNPTRWVDQQAVSAWRRRGSPQGRGRLQIDSDSAIKRALVARTVFHPSLRATQGFYKSLVRPMGLDFPVPAYSTACRRQAGLDLRLDPALAGRPRHILIHTTGPKVFGAAERYVRKHRMNIGR